jgi:cytochrome P450
VHHDRDCFGEDADIFRPERWLTDDTERVIAMERASLGFGSGKRVCLGRHIAELEIKKVIPTLLLRFKVSGSM